jgi:hypothetical protein
LRVLRLLLVTITMTLFGLGSGYFLWGARVARLTETVNGLTLEIDTMRERLAKPQDLPGGRASDELRVINESVAAFRQELAEQKILIQQNTAAATPADIAEAQADLRKLRDELATCIADKNDFEMRCGGNKPVIPGYAPSAPSYVPVPVAPPSPTPGLRPSTPPPPPADPRINDLSDPRF